MKKIVLVGLAGVPFLKRAIDVRLGATIELLKKSGYEVEVLNRYTPLASQFDNGGDTIINPFSKVQSGGRIKNLLLYILALLNEPFTIFASNRKLHIDALLVNSGHFVDILVYRMIAWIIGAKIVYQYCEYRAAFETNNPYHKLNGNLICKFAPKLWDGAICITTFLQESCKKINKNISTILMYPICDYSEFARETKYAPDYKYVMFCGSIEYSEVVDLIVNSYEASEIKDDYKLLLVLRGSKSLISKLQESHPDVIIKSDLPYNELIQHYKGASALLIPLRNTIRDIARFPNKVCEYCASESVVITTCYGEMEYLFKDGQNAFVANDFTVDEFSGALNRFGKNNDYRQVGQESYQLGLKKFNIDSYVDEMKQFIESL